MPEAKKNLTYLPNTSYFETEYIPGTAFVWDVKSPSKPFIISFEDDSVEAYAYAVDQRQVDKPIKDARLIYEAKALSRALKSKVCKLTVIWDAEGARALLLLDHFPHAFFDFKIEKAYCQTGKPYLSTWLQDDFRWQNRVLKFFIA